MPTRRRMELELYDTRGHRTYLTTAERTAFLTAAEETPREVRTLCGLLAHTGCRLSEASLTADRVDLRADLVVVETFISDICGALTLCGILYRANCISLYVLQIKHALPPLCFLQRPPCCL